MNSFLDFLLSLEEDPTDPTKRLSPNAPGVRRDNAIALPGLVATARGVTRTANQLESDPDALARFNEPSALLPQTRNAITEAAARVALMPESVRDDRSAGLAELGRRVAANAGEMAHAVGRPEPQPPLPGETRYTPTPDPSLPELRRQSVRSDAANFTGAHEQPHVVPFRAEPWQHDREAESGAATLSPDTRDPVERHTDEVRTQRLRDLENSPSVALGRTAQGFSDALTAGYATPAAARLASLSPNVSYEEARSAEERMREEQDLANPAYQHFENLGGLAGGLAQFSALSKAARPFTAMSDAARAFAATRGGQMAIQGGFMGALGAGSYAPGASLEDRLKMGGLSAAQGAAFATVFPAHAGETAAPGRESLPLTLETLRNLLPRAPQAIRPYLDDIAELLAEGRDPGDYLRLQSPEVRRGLSDLLAVPEASHVDPRGIRFNQRMDEALGVNLSPEERIVSRGTPVDARPPVGGSPLFREAAERMLRGQTTPREPQQGMWRQRSMDEFTNDAASDPQTLGIASSAERLARPDGPARLRTLFANPGVDPRNIASVLRNPVGRAAVGAAVGGVAGGASTDSDEGAFYGAVAGASIALSPEVYRAIVGKHGSDWTPPERPVRGPMDGEANIGAAIWVPHSGKVWIAPTHLLAEDAAREAGEDLFGSYAGFYTNADRLISRDESHAWFGSGESGQLRRRGQMRPVSMHGEVAGEGRLGDLLGADGAQPQMAEPTLAQQPAAPIPLTAEGLGGERGAGPQGRGLVYHEASPGRASEMVPGSNVMADTAGHRYFASSPDMALGQGRNRGILLGFDPSELHLERNTAKPGLDFAASQGMAELIGYGNRQTAYMNALRRVEVPDDMQVTGPNRAHLRNLTSALQREGWTTTQDGGRTIYTRPEPSGSGARSALSNQMGAIGDLRRRDLPASLRRMPNGMGPEEIRAWMQGEDAGLNGLARDVNQFEPGSPEWTAFERGWRGSQPKQRFTDPRSPQEPERVVDAAFRAEGQVYPSGMMVHAIPDNMPEHLADGAEHGFLTNRGRFITPEEAGQLHGVSPMPGKTRVVSEQVIPELRAMLDDQTGAIGDRSRVDLSVPSEPYGTGMGARAARGAAGAALGGAIGAGADKDSRLRGALLGAGIGATGGALAPEVRAMIEGMYEGTPARHLGSTSEAGVFGDPQAFYSRLDRSINEFPQERGTPQQWAAFLAQRTAKGEREWVGIDAFLRDAAERRELVTRDQIRALYDRNAIQLQEVQLGGTPETFRPVRQPDGMYAVENYRTGERVGEPTNNPAVAGDLARQVNAERGLSPIQRDSKYSQYTLPGGENYREVLVTLPVKDGFDSSKVGVDREGSTVAIRYDGRHIGTWVDEGQSDAHWISLMQRRFNGDQTLGITPQHSGYVSAHWDDPNVLLHLRTSDRTLPSGEKVLFVEEVQSDWHQQGRQNGYGTRAQDEALVRQWTQANGHPQFSSTPDSLRQAGAPPEVVAAKERLFNKAPDGVPDAPFKKTDEWMGLGMKRVLDEAAAGGYDRVAWTTGEQQASRYGLSKHVGEVVYTPSSGHLITYAPGEGHQVVFAEVGISPEKLPDYVGKEVAERLISSPDHQSSQIGAPPVKRLSGLDLRVGGEGMKSFYDRMVPNWVRDYARRLGVKLDVEPVRGSSEGAGRPLSDIDADIGALADSGTIDTPEGRARLRDLYLERDRVANPGMQTAEAIEGNPSFRVTPELRERIQQGQPIGQAPLSTLTALAGGGAGAAYGATQGDTPEERLANALILGAGGALAGGLAPRAARSMMDFAGNDRGTAGPGRTPVEFRDGRTVETQSYPPELFAAPDGTVHLNPGVEHSAFALDRLKGLYDFDGPVQEGSRLNTVKPARVDAQGRVVERGVASAGRGAAPEPDLPVPPATEPVAPEVQPQPTPIQQAASRLMLRPIGRLERFTPTYLKTRGGVPTIDSAEAELNAALQGNRPSPRDLYGLADGSLSPENFAERYGIDPAPARSYARAAQGLADDPSYVSPLDDPAAAHARPERSGDMDFQPPEPPGPVDGVPDDSFLPPDGSGSNGTRGRIRTPSQWLRDHGYGSGDGQTGLRFFPASPARTLGGAAAGATVGAGVGAIANRDDPLEGAAWGAGMGAMAGSLAPGMRAVSAARRAGLLTNLSGVERDIFQNALPTETLATGFANPIDAMMARHSGNRSVSFGLRGTGEAAWKGVTTGFADAGRKAVGRRVSTLGKAGAEAAGRAVEGSDRRIMASPFWDFFVRSIGQFRGSVDMPASVFAYVRGIDEQARVIAMNEGLKGPALYRRINELKEAARDFAAGGEQAAALSPEVRPLAESMNANAGQAVAVSTFTNENYASHMARRVGDAATSFAPRGTPPQLLEFGREFAGGVTDFFIPFKQVPGALAGMTVQMSPLALAKVGPAFTEWLRAIDRGAPVAEIQALQRTVALGTGRMALGTGIIAGGAILARDGLMTGAKPTEEQRRDGATPFSVRVPDGVPEIGGKWIPVASLPPVGPLLAFGAQWHLEGLGEAAPGFAKNVADMTLLRGTGDVQHLFGNESERNRVANSIASSFVPTIVGQVAQGMDGVQRKPANPLQAIEQRIPGLASNVPAKIDPATGKEVRTGPGGLRGVAERVVDFTRSREAQPSDPRMERELTHLGFTVPGVRREPGESDAQYTARQKRIGRAVHTALTQVLFGADPPEGSMYSDEEDFNPAVRAWDALQDVDPERLLEERPEVYGQMTRQQIIDYRKNEILASLVRQVRAKDSRPRRDEVRRQAAQAVTQRGGKPLARPAASP